MPAYETVSQMRSKERGKEEYKGWAVEMIYFLQTVSERKANNSRADDENGLARHCDVDCWRL